MFCFREQSSDATVLDEKIKEVENHVEGIKGEIGNPRNEAFDDTKDYGGVTMSWDRRFLPIEAEDENCWLQNIAKGASLDVREDEVNQAVKILHQNRNTRLPMDIAIESCTTDTPNSRGMPLSADLRNIAALLLTTFPTPRSFTTFSSSRPIREDRRSILSNRSQQSSITILRSNQTREPSPWGFRLGG